MENRMRDAAAEAVLQASDARALSRTFSQVQTVRDLERFATALERATSELMLKPANPGAQRGAPSRRQRRSARA